MFNIFLTFQPPDLTFTVGNSTVTPSKLLSDLGPGLAVVPLIGFLESIAIAKAFARKNRYTVDASQELVALGIANCLSSFVSSYPVTGSFSRTAVNAQSGVATPAGGWCNDEFYFDLSVHLAIHVTIYPLIHQTLIM